MSFLLYGLLFGIGMLIAKPVLVFVMLGIVRAVKFALIHWEKLLWFVLVPVGILLVILYNT